MQRLTRRVLTHLLAVLAISIVSGVQVADAHTSVVSTNPIYKSTLTSMPSNISITFTEPLMQIGEKKVNSISLTEPNGRLLNLATEISEASTLVATLPQREFIDGTYLVSYRVVSEDGHPVSGSYELYLNHPSEMATTTSPPASHEEHESFFHIHQIHLIEAGVGGILLILWWGYRRFNAEQSE